MTIDIETLKVKARDELSVFTAQDINHLIRMFETVNLSVSLFVNLAHDRLAKIQQTTSFTMSAPDDADLIKVERELFAEAWVFSNCVSLWGLNQGRGGSYKNSFTDTMWRIWQLMFKIGAPTKL